MSWCFQTDFAVRHNFTLFLTILMWRAFLFRNDSPAESELGFCRTRVFGRASLLVDLFLYDNSDLTQELEVGNPPCFNTNKCFHFFSFWQKWPQVSVGSWPALCHHPTYIGSLSSVRKLLKKFPQNWNWTSNCGIVSSWNYLEILNKKKKI